MKPKGRIALFFMRLSFGGVEQVLVTLANTLAAKGYTVDMVVLQGQGPLRTRVAPNVRLVDLGMHWYITALPRLVRYLWREQPQFLITGHIYMNTLAIAATLCNGFRNYLVISEHGPTKKLSRLSKTWLRRMAYRVLPKIYWLADARVAVSSTIAEELQNISGCRDIRVICNPVIDATFEQRMQQPVTHPWLTPKTLPVIIAVGRLNYQKDFSTLLRAFAGLRQRIPARLLILGEGEEQPILQTLAQQLGITADLDLLGYVDNVPPYLARSDLFVLSSISEGLPLAMVEALASGLPVVATECSPAVADIIDAEVGALVPIGDAAALAGAIHSILVGSDPINRMACRKKAEPFACENAAQDYLDMLERLSKSSQGGRHG